MNEKPLFTVPLNAEILSKHMAAAQPGDMFTYDSLAAKIGGEDPRKVWHSVKTILRRDHGLIFDCVRSEGYKCLSHSQIIDKGAGFRRKIKRLSSVRLKEIRVVDPAKLPADERVKYTAEVAVVGLIQATVSEEIRRSALQGKTLSIGRGPTTESLKSTFNS